MRWMARLALVLILTGAALLWVFDRPPVNMTMLKAIQQGASRHELEIALGRPSGIYEANQKWAYSRPLGWSIVYIYFDQDGRFKKYVYDY